MSHSVPARFVIRTILLVAAVLVLNQCSDVCEDRAEYVYYEAVYTSFEELRASVASVDPKPMVNTGKIYWKDNYLYINEPSKGIHVINNNDPANPIPVAFINIPGNFDLAIRDNILYADSYTDLVAIAGAPGEEKEVGRVRDVFQLQSMVGFIGDLQRGVVTDWKKESIMTVENTNCSYRYSIYGPMVEDGMFVNRSLESSFISAKASSTGPGGSSTGKAGSFARFAITGDYLYALNGANLEVFNIPHPSNIERKNPVTVAWDIETIFPLGQNLFLGSQSGMHIMDIQSPDAPTKISTYSHIRSCDPVVVEDGVAYVTLRNGSQCGGFTNQLEVINVADLTSPVLMKSYPMTNPHGVGIDNGTLFVCDGKDGLKIFSTSDRLSITDNQLAHYKDIQAFDIIPFNKVAMMIGESGLYQYDYSNLNDIKLLSHLPIAPAQ